MDDCPILVRYKNRKTDIIYNDVGMAMRESQKENVNYVIDGSDRDGKTIWIWRDGTPKRIVC